MIDSDDKLLGFLTTMIIPCQTYCDLCVLFHEKYFWDHKKYIRDISINSFPPVDAKNAQILCLNPSELRD